MSEPAISSKHDAPRYINPTDAADLKWYFATGRAQIDGKSNFGAMLERLSMFGQHARPCKACGGQDGTWDDDGNTVIPESSGSGFVWSSEESKMKKALEDLGLIEPVKLSGDLTCPRCKGRGWVVAAKRRSGRGPMMKVKAQHDCSGESGGNESLARLGHISRLFSLVKKASYRASEALESYYSPGGESEACLWHLTPAGKTMLKQNGHNLPERQFFENERNRQAENPNTERQLLFRAADSQAAELHAYMVELWTEIA
jgi:hypothetical protein